MSKLVKSVSAKSNQNKTILASFLWNRILMVGFVLMAGMYIGAETQANHMSNLMREAARYSNSGFNPKANVDEYKWVARSSFENGRPAITFDLDAIDHHQSEGIEYPNQALKRLEVLDDTGCEIEASAWQNMALGCMDDQLGSNEPPLTDLVESATCDDLEYYRDLAMSICDIRVTKTTTTVVTH